MCAQSLPAQTTSMSRGSRANHCVGWTSLSNSRRPMPRPTICVGLLLLGSIPFAELRAGSNISPRFAQPLPPPAPLWSTAPISPSASTSFSKLSHAPLPSSPSIPNTRPGAGKFTTQQRRTRLPALSGNSPKKSAPPAMTALSRSRPIAQAHIPEHTKLVLTPRPTASRCATRRAAVKVLPAVRCRPRAGSPASAVYSNFTRSSLNWADGSFWRRRLGFRQLMFKQARRNTMFTGTGTALVTPFRADGSLDEATLRRLLQRQIDAGIDFLVPCGTTGESPTLTHEEHLRVVEITVELVKGKVPVLAGAGGYNTAEVISLGRELADLGADGILSVTPYYNKPTQEGLFQHYRAIAEAVPLPIVLYSVQGRTGVNIEPGTVKRLARIENIVGIKEASGNVSQMAAILSAAPDDFVVLSGDDAITLPLISLGGREIHRRFHPLMEINFVESNPIPVKAALAEMGLLEPVWRLPLVPPKAENRARIRAVLESLELVPRVHAAFAN